MWLTQNAQLLLLGEIQVTAECHKRGLIILACGMYGNVIRFLPALTISDAEIDEGLALFSEALRQAGDGQG